jgi:hypothetical protein
MRREKKRVVLLCPLWVVLSSTVFAQGQQPADPAPVAPGVVDTVPAPPTPYPDGTITRVVPVLPDRSTGPSYRMPVARIDPSRFPMVVVRHEPEQYPIRFIRPEGVTPPQPVPTLPRTYRVIPPQR